MKKILALITMGALNLTHGIFHIIQFIQSIILSTRSNHDGIFDSPIFSVIWAAVGLFSLIIGIRDYIHHKKCNHKIDDNNTR